MGFTLVPGARGATPVPGEGDEGGDVLVGASDRVYRLGSVLLGAGGQAEVWPGVRDDGLPVAIKLSYAVPASVAAVSQEADCLEAIAAAGLTMAVPCLDRVEAGGRFGIVLPLYEKDVDHHVAACVSAEPSVAIERVLGIAATIARALGRLHALDLPGGRGHLVHRDIKPENILVDAHGAIHLADFGGSLVVAGPGSLALGVFGSPMWAPFDQMLPGLPEPNPTWDTYACCVMLFWWITQGRPAYQSDPSPMLTASGRAIWNALAAFGAAEAPEDRTAALRRLFVAREGMRAAGLVDVRGHAAIQAEDRAALAAGVERLVDPALYGPDALRTAARALADLLGRGLSPLSHPSPPNRFWKADDLADELDGIAAALSQARAARVADAERSRLRGQIEALEANARQRAQAPVPRRGAYMAVAAVGLGGVGLLGSAAAVAAWLLPGPEAREPAVDDPTVVVGAGTFDFGDTWGDGEDDERPVRAVTLPAFRMERTEVSNDAYQACVTTGVCTPLAWKVPGSPWELGVAKGGDAFRGLDGGTQPAVGVTYAQASTWCAWKGGRLPTEEEWERAATTGPEGPKAHWPWGDAAPDCTRATFKGCGDHTLPVGALPAGASAWGALDLVGNVWEWTSGVYTVVKRELFRKTTLEHRVLRGGAWSTPDTSMRPTFRRHAEPERVSELHGFRCVYGM